MPDQRSAASQIWPGLPQGTPNEVAQSKPTLADAMWPGPKPPPGWHREAIALIQRASGSDIEIARRYGISKQVVGQIRKLGRG
jgi:hypothetical protein